VTATERTASGSPTPSSGGGAPVVLVVDDDQDIRDVIALRLRLDGFEVHTEADGEAGLAAALQLRPALVLTDWMMPRMTGPELCQHLRASPETATTAILLLTARAQEGDVQRGFAAGADDYIVKPFSPRELSSRVRAVLSRTQRRP
jgi:two-component system phosphate regulon response regulator PhoB